MKRGQFSRRTGAVTVEVAIVGPIIIFLILGVMGGAIGVFRYQQVALLAREGARWASVRGQQYSASLHDDSATAEEIYEAAVKPMSVGMRESDLSYEISWPKFADGNDDKRQGNLVTVTVRYKWSMPPIFVPIEIKSTSKMPISF